MLWSDNGTNFIGAEKELRECVEKWSTLNIAAKLAHKGIKWRFSPPSAPHQGGIWERLVRSFKRVLYTNLGTRRLTDVLNTTSCLVEYALNLRPLTPVSADPSDLGAITSNHFLLGNQATRIPSIGDDKFDYRKWYARAQSYANAIWERWLKEYVPALNCRSKWQTPAERHLKVGDLVWIVEESNPLGVTIRLLGLKNSVAVPTASPAPPSYARRPDRSSALSLSLYRSSQHFLPGRRMLLSK